VARSSSRSRQAPVRARVEAFPLEDAPAALRKIAKGEIDGAAVLRIR
jgi:hypothetical protein